ncbi:hypothetical protein [Laspinema olomoucense]|uniref:hypothetical protein n=1 Tax=Laspinema olomoucense TaxID=3231600 RepID=UPI0021BA3DB0|nr:hypothetical protein [Laspinema sp. D3d]MCT7974746.1 hypothetical protein [Laspinema sp. D3d]
MLEKPSDRHNRYGALTVTRSKDDKDRGELNKSRATYTQSWQNLQIFPSEPFL